MADTPSRSWRWMTVSLVLVTISIALWSVLFSSMDLDNMGLTDKVLGFALITGMVSGVILILLVFSLVSRRLLLSRSVVAIAALAALPFALTVSTIWELTHGN